MAAGCAGACLHTMALMQASQTYVLKDLDEGQGPTLGDLAELRRASHLWLKLSGMKENDRAFLLDLGNRGDALTRRVEGRFEDRPSGEKGFGNEVLAFAGPLRVAPQSLLGLMAAASNVIPFGLLYMRPLQWRLKTKGFSSRGNPFCMIRVRCRCLRAMSLYKRLWFLSQGPVLGASCHRKVISTDLSLTGWGAVMDGCFARGLWLAQHSSWHIHFL